MRALIHYATVALTLGTATAIEKVEKVVEIANGATIVGHPSPRNPQVTEYLGIPYADPPVGELRFMPPKEYVGNGTIRADKYSPDCPSKANVKPYTKVSPKTAAIIGAQGQVNHTMNEDCLTLNIWTKRESGEAKKAVLIWLHGGGFNIGSSSQPAFDGAALASEEDVILVTMNYRLNIFGFPTAPGVVNQNPGLLDQRLAMEWVRKNIEAFGGDTSRITLFGESAGGIAVDLYTYAWTKDPIANGFIAQSGTAMLRVSGVKVGDYSKWFDVSKKVGCGGEEAGEKTVQCMQKKPFEALLSAFEGGSNFNKPQPFGLYPDNLTVFSDYFSRGRSGNFVKKPFLVGHNDLESGLFRFLSELDGTVSESALAYIDQGYACPPGAAASYRVTHGVNAWRYRYHGVFPNQEISPKAGAYHSSEIPLLFGTTEDTGKDTPSETQLAKNMRHAWAEFAKDPVNGLVKLGWPVYNQNVEKNPKTDWSSKGKTLVQLGLNNSAIPSFEFNRVYDSKCPSYVEEALVKMT